MSSSFATIPFVKASACGNDFIIIDGQYAPADAAALTRSICDRHEGVGADGVEWLFSAADADIDARLFNADGREAEISGNGTRCVAAYLRSQQPRDKFLIRTGAGVKTCVLTSQSDNEYEFETAMGKPQIEAELVLKLSFGEVRGIPVSVGNPHYVMFVNEFVHGWQSAAAEIGGHPDFPRGVNVELAVVQDSKNLRVRFFERGVGETQSSGTGSCAAAIAAISAGKASSPVRVYASGGTQTVRSESGGLFLRGPARLVCRGEFFVPNQ